MYCKSSCCGLLEAKRPFPLFYDKQHDYQQMFDKGSCSPSGVTEAILKREAQIKPLFPLSGHLPLTALVFIIPATQ